MLLIVVLQELTELAKHLVARTTLVGIFGSVAMAMARAIGEKRRARQVGSHGRLRRGVLVNAFASIILAATATAIPAFHMLHGIGTRTKPSVATNGTGKAARTMDLGVHIQLVVVGKRATAFVTFKSRAAAAAAAMNTGGATRSTFAFAPLIVAKVVASAPIITRGTVPNHLVQVEKQSNGKAKLNCGKDILVVVAHEEFLLCTQVVVRRHWQQPGQLQATADG